MPPQVRDFPPWCLHWARKLVRSGGDLLFAPECAACAVALEVPSDLAICAACCEQFCDSANSRCGRCGQPTLSPIEPGQKCRRCRAARLKFNAALTLGDYRGKLREAVLRLKYPGHEPLGMALAKLFWRENGARLAAWPLDVVAAVPMHWRRRWKRGVNSPELLAEILARQLGLPLARWLVVRRRNTLPQADLPPSRRFQNVRGAFTPGAGYVMNGTRVLLVDDVLTTGATASAIARVLRQAGAESVRVAVLARAQLAD